MKLAVFSHKPCWTCAASPTGYATDGGFPFQMAAIAELFDETVLLVPCSREEGGAGEIPLAGPRMRVAPLPAPYGAGLGRKLLFPLWGLRCAPAILREFRRADAVHAPIPGDIGTVGMALAWFFRKPLFVRYCGNWLTIKSTADRFWHWFMETFAGGRNIMLATGGTAEPPSQKNANVRWIFSSSLTAAEMEALRGRQPKLDRGRLRLITVGRQQAEKGTDKLVEALAIIRRQIPQAQLDVVGDGSDVARLKRQAAGLGIGDAVVFHGRLDHAKVLDMLQQAHIFCFPSRSEGFPKAVLEAMSCGLPVIATPVSALPMLLSTGGGILIEPDGAAVARAVFEVACSEEKYTAMSDKARDTAREYTLERWREAIGGHLSAGWGLLRKQETARPLRGLRICLLAGTLGQGGAERQLFYIATALKTAGAEVRVLTLIRGEVWEARLEARGIPVEFVGGARWRFGKLLAVCKAAGKFRPDIVQSQHFYTNAYGAIAARLCGARSVGAVRNDGLSDLRDCGRFFGRLCLRLPDRLAANSQLAMRNLTAMGCRRENLFYLPNTVDLTHFQSPGSRNGEMVTVLGIGRLARQKRFDRFLRIVQMVHRSCKTPFRVLIVGEGLLRPELEKLAQESGLRPGMIEFRGNVPDAQALYGKAHVLLLSSDHEGTPNVVMEAMASGLPVVATAVGDVPALIQHGVTGFMVEPSDEEGAVRHLEALVSDRSLRETMGARAHSFIESRHALGGLPGHLAELYSGVLS